MTETCMLAWVLLNAHPASAVARLLATSAAFSAAAADFSMPISICAAHICISDTHQHLRFQHIIF